ncbi:hypothetical protein GC207_09720 [bacterium]|nr:hypothetical protein [bacterium]
MENNRKKRAKPLPALPLPRKAAAAIREVPLVVGQKKVPAELAPVLKKTLQNVGPDIVADISQVFAPLRKRFAAQLEGCSIAEAFTRLSEIETSILNENPTFAATVPVVLERTNTRKSELIASGVLIRIVDRTFLLTAAHVTDQQNNGELLIPGGRGFMPLSGSFSSMRLPPSGKRSDDKLDVAYFWLDDNCVVNLDSRCRVLERPDVSLEAEPTRRTTYTFAGFPWRRGKTRGQSIETDFNTFSGFEAKQSEYDELGLTRSRHIAVRFHRKRTFSSRHKKVVHSPHPSGMSGGGVYVWSEESLDAWPIRLPLIGIATDFVPEKSLLIATRLCIFIQCIFHNQPDLAVIAGG